MKHATVRVDEAALTPASYQAFDYLATMVAVIRPDGHCLFANATFEQVLGLSRRAVLRSVLFDWFADADKLRDTVAAVTSNEFSTSRLEASLKRGAPHGETLPVHVIVNQMDRPNQVLIEMIRNLAHEIKNPLGGIRGAAQLLAMEIESRELTEYTQVIVHEADRLQLLVDRLLAPHRRPHVVGDVNIHEVCERVRSLILAEFPRGLQVERDYDISIPEFRGDREQLIQAVLNIAHNAAHALADRIGTGDACIHLRTRIARQVTLGKTRFRLALELHIEDNGPGIPDSIRDRIFYPLVSGREGGSGLGLTLAQTFVQQHHGTIDCESEPGRTNFKIVIPLP